LDVYSADPVNHFFFQFRASSVKSRCLLISVIWFATSVIWKEKNDRIFRGQQKSYYQFLESIKFFFSCGLRLSLFCFIQVLWLVPTPFFMLGCWLAIIVVVEPIMQLINYILWQILYW